MSGVLDGGQKIGHGIIDANDPRRSSGRVSRIERLDNLYAPSGSRCPLVCVGCDALSELGLGSRYHGLTQVDQPGL
jgi:hypothetical protein